jgi:glycosyltransferase involved in cell wall biosynthesis
MNFLYIDKGNCLNEVKIAERVIWGQEIPKMGHNVEFLLTGVDRKIIPTGINHEPNHIIIPYKRFGSFRLIKLIVYAMKVVKNKNIEFIVIRNAIDLAFIAYIVGKIMNKKMVYLKMFPRIEFMISQNNNKLSMKILLLRLLILVDRILINRSNYILSQSVQYSTYLRDKHGISNRAILSVPMGIDAEGIRPYPLEDKIITRKKYDITDQLTAIYFGTLDKERKIDFIINVIENVVRKSTSIKCIVVGGNHKALENLRKIITERGLTQYFILIDTLPTVELFDVIRAADFSLSPIPPVEEFIISSPTKVVESLALGIPVIANEEIVDQNDVISRSGGGIVLPYDEQKYSDTILNIINQPSLLERMGEQGAHWVIRERSYSRLAGEVISYLSNESNLNLN